MKTSINKVYSDDAGNPLLTDRGPDDAYPSLRYHLEIRSTTADGLRRLREAIDEALADDVFSTAKAARSAEKVMALHDQAMAVLKEFVDAPVPEPGMRIDGKRKANVGDRVCYPRIGLDDQEELVWIDWIAEYGCPSENEYWIAVPIEKSQGVKEAEKKTILDMPVSRP